MAPMGQVPTQQNAQMINPNTPQGQQAFQQMNQPQQQQAQRPMGQQIPPGMENQAAFASMGQKPITQAEKIKIGQNERALELKKQTHDEKMELERTKLSSKYTDKLLDTAEANQQNIDSLDELERLDNEGKLISSDVATVLSHYGLDIPILMNPESEEYKELTTNFLRNARSMFGARITDNELKMFMHTLPTLMNTPEGRRRIVRNLKLYNQPAIIRKQTMMDIIDEYGTTPTNLRLKIEKRARPQLDEVSRKLKMGINNDPEYQKKYVDQQMAKGVNPESLIDISKIQPGSEMKLGGKWWRKEGSRLIPLKE